MKIKELKQFIDEAYKKGKENDVEVWLRLDDGEEIIGEIESIGQFNIVPDMTITFKPAGDKIYGSRPLTKEQLDYKRKYENLQKKINKFLDLVMEEE